MNDPKLQPVVFKRLADEAKQINDEYKYTLRLDIRDHFRQLWHVTFECPDDSHYAGDVFTLQFRFCATYPFECPEVKFIQRTPKHEHINFWGYISDAWLERDWTTKTTVADCCLKIIKMLTNPDLVK